MQGDRSQPAEEGLDPDRRRMRGTWLAAGALLFGLSAGFVIGRVTAAGQGPESGVRGDPASLSPPSSMSGGLDPSAGESPKGERGSKTGTLATTAEGRADQPGAAVAADRTMDSLARIEKRLAQLAEQIAYLQRGVKPPPWRAVPGMERPADPLPDALRDSVRSHYEGLMAKRVAYYEAQLTRPGSDDGGAATRNDERLLAATKRGMDRLGSLKSWDDFDAWTRQENFTYGEDSLAVVVQRLSWRLPAHASGQ